MNHRSARTDSTARAIRSAARASVLALAFAFALVLVATGRPGQALAAQLVAQADAPTTTAATTVAPADPAPKASGAKVAVSAWVQGSGWKKAVAGGKTAGTVGKHLQLGAIKLKVSGTGLSGGIRYRVHTRGGKWQAFAKDGAVAGKGSVASKLDGVKIALTGDLAKHYDVYYRTHSFNHPWTPWSKNGTLSGVAGTGPRLDALQVKLSPKTAVAAGKKQGAVSVRYDVRMQGTGWKPHVADGKTAGAAGKSKRVQALGMVLSTGTLQGGVKYRAHMQGSGWQKWKSDGATAGTAAKSLRVEALQVKLTGAIAKSYDVYYRVYAQDIGWLDWAANGATAGTTGCSYRLEAFQVKLVKKGAAAPGATQVPSAAGRWQAKEAKYRANAKVNQILEVRYTGGTRATVVLRKKKADKTWATVLLCQGYTGQRGIGNTREGLSMTPQGDFGITKAFGILSNPGAKLPYVKVTSDMYWCGDRAYYNQLINIKAHPHNCNGEHLIDYRPHYNYGLFFDYNTKPIRYGKGSAFFVHCTGSKPYTAGCIAVSQANMVKIIKNVSSGARLCIYPK